MSACRLRRKIVGISLNKADVIRCDGFRMTMTRDELLAAYTAGAASPGLSLLCAAHLTLRPDARAYVSGLEEVGGQMLLEQEAPECDAPANFDALLAKIDAEEDQQRAGAALLEMRPSDEVDAGPLPRPVSRALGRRFSDVPWKSKLWHIAEHVLFENDGEKVSLMRARPGARVPDHTHRGEEATLVLTGMMKDGEEVLTPGDIALCGPEHHHHPEILGDETCYCLIVVDGKLRFNGALGRALNLFAE